MARALVLVDGEHHPPVLRAALERLPADGVEPIAALVLGGTEKVAAHGAELDLGVPVRWVPPAATVSDRGASAEGAFDVALAAGVIETLIEELRPDEVYDLSDAPPLDARGRMRLAAHVLRAGLAYRGPDFRFDPPARPRLADAPSIAVIGTGKRIGKTAITGALVRALAEQGHRPGVLALGRGGPAVPCVEERGRDLDTASLLRIADDGGHAASDCYEGALISGAVTVGARRAGGGLAGAVGYANLEEAARALGAAPHDLVVFEGSGASVPPAHADATVLVVPGDADPELVSGYLGPYRILLADAVVVTLAEPPTSSPQRVEEILRGIRSISPGTVVLRTIFRPHPLQAVDGAKVFLVTTAPAAVGAALTATLETRYGCEVVGISHRLADRPGLLAELEAAPPFEVLLAELKAAAVDVAARFATEVGARVVFCDNRPEVVTIDDPLGVLREQDGKGAAAAPDTALATAARHLAGLAIRRDAER